ncbi:AAA family ATPase [Nonomuraea sp. NPDC050310]|uniref:AAA family ATPase n=1 Tax=Nonomuraea sp. NPDC050310 TaxID=3154935 RepID=UPI0033E1CE61
MTIRLPVGQDHQRARLLDALDGHRLVAVTGPGGSGKSVLARTAADDHPDSLVVDLARARESDLTDLPRTGLLVLETCEHVLDRCAQLVEDRLAAGTGQRILLTGRESIGAGERTLSPAPLGPDDAARLYHQVSGGLAVDPLVLARLDGLPLAVHIAAEHLLDTRTLAARLDDGTFYDLPAAPHHPERHTTLRASAAWSHALCSSADRMTWALLATLPGAFSLDEAQAVLDRDAREPVARLVEKSVLVVDVLARDARWYRMPQYLRAYVLPQPLAFTL